jgi:hypothetical protein
MRKCVVAMTTKMPAASGLFGKIEAPPDAIRLTLWTEGVFVARDRHVAESEKSERWWHTSGRLLFGRHMTGNASRATAGR